VEYHGPITILGRSKRSRRIEKQKVVGTGAPDGFKSTQCEYTERVVFSKAWEAKFSQYSTTDWFSKSWKKVNNGLAKKSSIIGQHVGYQHTS
jgi:hypothetical protein